MADPANRSVKFDLEIAKTARQICDWSQERADAWRERKNDAAREEFLAAIGGSQSTPGPAHKTHETMRTQESGGDADSDDDEPAGNSKDDERLKEVESESDGVEEVGGTAVAKPVEREVWSAKDPRQRMRAIVQVPIVPFPSVPMSARKKPVSLGFRFLLCFLISSSRCTYRPVNDALTRR